MKKIFERGDFSSFKITDTKLYESRRKTLLFSESSNTAKVFISHKHSDLEDLKGIIGFLSKEYNINVYIDGFDPEMPAQTCGETATRIKDIIQRCDKFILLATDDAIESKWCNWELGFGDAHKYKKNITLFPIKDKGKIDGQYKGNEYMQIYWFISRLDETKRLKNGKAVVPGYYVCYYYKNKIRIKESLDQWLRSY